MAALTSEAALYLSVPVGAGRSRSIDVIKITDPTLLLQCAISALEESVEQVETETNPR
jgi:hypothetical protein